MKFWEKVQDHQKIPIIYPRNWRWTSKTFISYACLTTPICVNLRKLKRPLSFTSDQPSANDIDYCISYSDVTQLSTFPDVSMAFKGFIIKKVKKLLLK